MKKHNQFNFNIITEPFSNLNSCDPFCLPEEPNKFSKKLLELEERINNLVFEQSAEYKAGQGVRFTVDNDKKVINVLINEELLEFKDNKIDLKIEELKKIFGESGGVVAASEWGKITGDITKQQDLHKLLNSKATTTQLDNVSAEVAQLDKKIGNITNTVSNLNTSVSSLLDEVNEHKTSIKSLETFKTDTDESLNNLLGRLESLEGTAEDLDLETINQTVEGLQSTVAEFKSKLEKHTTDIAELNTKILTHESEVDDKFSAINTSLDSMIHDITQVYNIVESLDLEAINNTVESIQTQMTAINETVNTQNGKISELEGKVKTNTSDITELNGKVADIVELQDTVADHTADIAKLNTTVNQAVSDLSALSELIEALDVYTIALTLQELQTQVYENNTKIESIVDIDIAQIKADIARLSPIVEKNNVTYGSGLRRYSANGLNEISLNYNREDFTVDGHGLSLRKGSGDIVQNMLNASLVDGLAYVFATFVAENSIMQTRIKDILIDEGYNINGGLSYRFDYKIRISNRIKEEVLSVYHIIDFQNYLVDFTLKRYIEDLIGINAQAYEEVVERIDELSSTLILKFLDVLREYPHDFVNIT